jgi:hypothetical protein
MQKFYEILIIGPLKKAEPSMFQNALFWLNFVTFGAFCGLFWNLYRKRILLISIMTINIKMQQLFHWLRSSKQLNICNLTKVNGIHETKTDKIYETKRNFTFDETKRNEISLFLLFRETSEISRNNFFVSLCFVFRET